MAFPTSRALALSGLFAAVLVSAGCHSQVRSTVVDSPQPNELAKMSLPSYVIEPPDILKIDALYLIPLPPYRVQSLDVLAIRVTNTLPDEPIAGLFSIETDGTVLLGPSYGSVKLAGLTLDEAKKVIEKQLLKILKEPKIDLYVAQGRGVQQVRGEHLVRPDGTVSLGSYGSVKVAGLTLMAAKKAIEAHLEQFLQQPEVVLDVLAYNSKVYYIIFDQGGSGQRIIRFPITGNDTVLDAMAQASGTSVVSDEKRMWISRPTAHSEEEQILKIDWRGITAHGRSQTNYQLLPGDRIFVKADPLITADTRLSRLLAPFERIMGFSLLTSSTIQTLRFRGSGINSGIGGFGGF